MFFVVNCIDKNDSTEIRLANRETHLEFIANHSNVVKLAGPFLDDAGNMIGSLFILEAKSKTDLQNILANDPYNKAGLFASVTITPWREVINNWS